MRVIAVLFSGFVFVGDTEQTVACEEILLTNAKNIRKYGTTAGLGQLALTGRTPETVLDKVGTLRINRSALLFFIEVAPNVDL